MRAFGRKDLRANQRQSDGQARFKATTSQAEAPTRLARHLTGVTVRGTAEIKVRHAARPSAVQDSQAPMGHARTARASDELEQFSCAALGSDLPCLPIPSESTPGVKRGRCTPSRVQ